VNYNNPIARRKGTISDPHLLFLGSEERRLPNMSQEPFFSVAPNVPPGEDG